MAEQGYAVIHATDCAMESGLVCFASKHLYPLIINFRICLEDLFSHFDVCIPSAGTLPSAEDGRVYSSVQRSVLFLNHLNSLCTAASQTVMNSAHW